MDKTVLNDEETPNELLGKTADDSVEEINTSGPKRTKKRANKVSTFEPDMVSPADSDKGAPRKQSPSKPATNASKLPKL